MAKRKAKNYNHHTLVPKHEKLSEKQKNDLLKEFKCNLGELPKLLATDAAIMDMNPKVDDVFKIHRFSRTEGISVFYRVVVDE
ncbi:DNA-directed RNA polymerase subunit H [Candidatus Woesearchaeota archaeon]|nr:DNA-directed RNA polymerase subunit H [Candidatus Woesearchaeota archaeon]